MSRFALGVLMTPCGPLEPDRGRDNGKRIFHWLTRRNRAKRSAHKRKRCLDCGKIYPRSTNPCPVCGSSAFRLRSH